MREARNGQPMQRAHKYKTLDEAKADGNVSESTAKARIAAQDLAGKLRKEGPTSGQEK